MNKKTLYGAEARAKVLEGVKKISAAVKVTLGPSGRNVLISQSAVIDYGVHSLPIHITKDGHTVARSFDLDEPFEKAGVLMIKEATQKTVDQAGDGTTTCCVLAEAIVIEGMKLVDAGANPVSVKRGIDAAVEKVVEGLKKMATPVKGDMEKIRQIATVSANNDKEVGDWIAKAFEKIGDEGVIDLEGSNMVETELKLTDGYKIGNGWVSPQFVNNERLTCEFENPVILLYEKKITHHTQIQTAATTATQMQRPLLIICEDAEGEGLAYLAINNQRNMIRCCVVRTPGRGDERRNAMEDLATLTGATYVSDIRGVDITKITPANFGACKKAIISKDETIIIEGAGNETAIEELKNELRMNLAQAKNEDEKAPIEKRLATVSGAIAVIKVGGPTITEMKERLDRFDDAVRATKAAISEGFVAGGGIAFLRTELYVDGSELSDIQKGERLVYLALESPLRQICVNAGIDPNEKLTEIKRTKKNIGYNAKTDTIEDLVISGIIDPVKVLRCALQNAASSAGMILTSECLIVDTL